jgi:ribosome-binding protein aMBF1 (putative translation factor)
MPWTEVNVQDEIEKRCQSDPEFKTAWDNSRMEYAILGEFMKLRNEQGLTQKNLAEKTKTKQQVISRVEKHEQSPTLKTLCGWANALNVELKLVPR